MVTEKQSRPTHSPTTTERSSNKVGLQTCEVIDPTFTCSLFYSLHARSQTNIKTVMLRGPVRLTSSKSQGKKPVIFFVNASTSIHFLTAGKFENILCSLRF